MAAYEGTCIFITHDRQMVHQVADRILEMTPEGVNELSPEQFVEAAAMPTAKKPAAY